MLEETFIYIYAGWKQQKCHKRREDETGVKVLRLFITSIFFPPFVVKLLKPEERSHRKRAYRF